MIKGWVDKVGFENPSVHTIHPWAKEHISTLNLELPPNRRRVALHKLRVPCRRRSESTWEGGHCADDATL